MVVQKENNSWSYSYILQMNKISIFFILIFVSFIRTYVFAEYWSAFRPGTEPNGFRGIRWGTDIKDTKFFYDRKYKKEGDRDYIYVKDYDNLVIERFQFDEIKYGFLEGKKFNSVEAFIKDNVDEKTWNLFKSVFIKRYGKKYEMLESSNFEIYRWQGDVSTLKIVYNKNAKSIKFLLYHKFPGVTEYTGRGRFKPLSEPDGFKGIRWGADISSLSNMKLMFPTKGKEFPPGICYIKEDDNLTIEGIEFESILYIFGRDDKKLVGIKATKTLNTLRDWLDVKKAFSKKYGDDYRRTKYSKDYEHIAWEGMNTIVSLSLSSFYDSIFVSFISSTAMQQAISYLEPQTMIDLNITEYDDIFKK